MLLHILAHSGQVNNWFDFQSLKELAISDSRQLKDLWGFQSAAYTWVNFIVQLARAMKY